MAPLQACFGGQLAGSQRTLRVEDAQASQILGRHPAAWRCLVDGVCAVLSNTGRDIPVATIGDGPTPVMFIAIQHGNEFVVSTLRPPLPAGSGQQQPGAGGGRDAPAVDERQPEFVVDFHHQGTYADENGRMITSSVMWPNAVEEAERIGISEEFAETVTLSKRVVSEMLVNLEQYGHANVTRYPSTTFPGIARNAYGLLGSGSVLYEARGGIGQKSAGYIAKQSYIAGMSVLTAAADGTLWTRSTGPADSIRERGDFVSDPHE